MVLNASTLRPGLLVSLKTSVSGNVHYVKRMIEADHMTKEGKKKSKWETVRWIDDPAEHEAAEATRSKASYVVSRICAASAFGLLCPDANTKALEEAIIEAREICETFNAKSSLSRVQVYVIAGRIAQDDVEAVRAISSEIRDLLDAMKSGVSNLDVKAIRDAANKARSLGMMLSPEASERIKEAIDAARIAARQIVKAGENAAQEVDKSVIKTLTHARTSFLDLGEEQEIAKPESKGRALDLAPEEVAPVVIKRVRRSAPLELE